MEWGGGQCLCKFKAGLVRIVSYRLEITCVREKKGGWESLVLKHTETTCLLQAMSERPAHLGKTSFSHLYTGPSFLGFFLDGWLHLFT